MFYKGRCPWPLSLAVVLGQRQRTATEQPATEQPASEQPGVRAAGDRAAGRPNDQKPKDFCRFPSRDLSRAKLGTARVLRIVAFFCNAILKATVGVPT